MKKRVRLLFKDSNCAVLTSEKFRTIEAEIDPGKVDLDDMLNWSLYGMEILDSPPSEMDMKKESDDALDTHIIVDENGKYKRGTKPKKSKSSYGRDERFDPALNPVDKAKDALDEITKPLTEDADGKPLSPKRQRGKYSDAGISEAQMETSMDTLTEPVLATPDFDRDMGGLPKKIRSQKCVVETLTPEMIEPAKPVRKKYSEMTPEEREDRRMQRKARLLKRDKAKVKDRSK